MTSIAIVGARGYVGHRLLEILESRDDCRVTGIVRETYETHRGTPWDVLINAAMPAARFRARRDPAWDFEATVSRTADLVHGWSYRKLVQISSLSARCQVDTAYGRHKAAAERLVDPASHLVVRLGSMYDRTLRKGVLIDMLHDRRVWVAGNSRYCFASLDFVAGWIADNLERVGVVEVGARDAIPLHDVAAAIGSVSSFDGPLDHQEIPEPLPGFPAAAEVIGFLEMHGPELRRTTS